MEKGLVWQPTDPAEFMFAISTGHMHAPVIFVNPSLALRATVSPGFFCPASIFLLQSLITIHTLMPWQTTFFTKAFLALRTQDFCLKGRQLDGLLTVRSWTKALIL